MGFNRSSSPAPPPAAPVVSRDRMEGDYNPAVKKSREEAQRQFYKKQKGSDKGFKPVMVDTYGQQTVATLTPYTKTLLQR